MYPRDSFIPQSIAQVKGVTLVLNARRLAGWKSRGQTDEQNAKTETQQPGVMTRSTDRHAGRSYGAPIPLSGEITPKFIYSIAKSFIYTLHMLVEFHLLTSLFSFLHNYSFSFIYLQNIILTDYIPTVIKITIFQTIDFSFIVIIIKMFLSKLICSWLIKRHIFIFTEYLYFLNC